MGYGLDGRGLIPGRVKIFLLSVVPRPALGPIQSLMQWIPAAISLGVKQPDREADHSPPSSVDVKNGGAIPPLLSMSSWLSA
jgi:hypothetical protein